MYAVIDIGSNTIRMVLYKVVNGELRQMLNSKEPAGLVGYVENGRLTGEGIDKLTDTLSHFKLILESVRVKKVLPFATASLRNIENRDEALSAVQKTCGWRVRVLSGLEEAMCDYYGASRLFHTADGLLCDVGGGSTEIVLARGGLLVEAFSFQVGTLRLLAGAVAPDERRRLARELASLTKTYQPRKIIATGGNINKIAKLLDKKEGKSATPQELRNLHMALRGLSLEDRMDKFRLNSYRADVIVPALEIFLEVADTVGATRIIIPKIGLVDGIVRHMCLHPDARLPQQPPA